MNVRTSRSYYSSAGDDVVNGADDDAGVGGDGVLTDHLNSIEFLL